MWYGKKARDLASSPLVRVEVTDNYTEIAMQYKYSTVLYRRQVKAEFTLYIGILAFQPRIQRLLAACSLVPPFLRILK
jgi:hypothetical protein